MAARPGATTPARVRVLDDGREASRTDTLAAEEPLEIRVAASGGDVRTVAVTMRTPGADFELAAGFLHTEGVVAGRDAIRRIDYCLDGPRAQLYNTVTVHLASAALPELASLERYGTVSSACGVCGKASLEALQGPPLLPPPVPARPAVDRETLYALPDRLRAAQRTFATTGGLHAAGLFTAEGESLCVREDVGRHNAVDKVVGWALLRGVSLAGTVLVVSGRAGFEIVQKAVASGIPIVCAVSAPSSLAVAAATEFGLTLVGFLRGRRANVYADAGRLR